MGLMNEELLKDIINDTEKKFAKLEKKEIKIGNRNNKGKLRWRNIPPFLIKPLVEVGQMGELKYGTYNFLNGLMLNDTMDSLQRHLDAFLDPAQSDIDEESGLNHLAHISWNALVALYHLNTRPELDDRFKLEDKND